MPKHTYIAQIFRQRADSNTELLLFVAPAGELKKWAGVPRKTFDYQHGFQRTLHPGRVGELSQFFAEDAENVSPTSIVLGINLDQTYVKISPIKGKGASDGLVTIEVDIPDFEQEPIETLIRMAAAHLETRLPKETIDEIHKDLDAAVSAAISLEDEEQVDDTFGGSDETDTLEALQQSDRSFLGDFYAELMGYERGLIPVKNEGQLRQILFSLLKPAIIVDGQHRVFGAAAADETIRLPVCALAGSNWVENVYQFVVINQKAKPIKPAFLSSIIATSLTDDEIQSVFNRLEVSKVNVDKAQIMNRVDRDAESPFKGMIDFEVQGAPGFLQFPGMHALVKQFQNIPKSHRLLLSSDDWEADNWLPHFYALWSGVKEYFTSQDNRLWNEPSDANPNNLLKIVTLQQIQTLMLDNWTDSRFFKFGAPEDTKKAAIQFWDQFPATFFTDEWKQKGLQTSVGRKLLSDTMMETRRNIGRKNWGHRRLKLFSD